MMPVSLLLTTRFLQLLTQRSIAEAERVLERIKEKAGIQDERTMGYMAALQGALIALKSNDDRYAFIMRTDADDKSINRFKNEFIRHERSEIHSDYDRGYFSAWAEYMRVLSKTASRKVTAPPEKKQTTLDKFEESQKLGLEDGDSV
ncbi:MAG TPA: hypothetical protein VJ574_03585 [Candidatus Bathyarchaeia archaeon]|nr:hypothetical protein [Candidatus Bathyarchaeia archaeon]